MGSLEDMVNNVAAQFEPMPEPMPELRITENTAEYIPAERI